MEVNQYNYPPSKMRHSAEAEYARKLLKKGINYRYQPVVQLSVGVFHPDFYLIRTKEYVEIVGTRQALDQARRKIALFREQHSDKTLLILDRNGNPWGQMNRADLGVALRKTKRIIHHEQIKNRLTPSGIKTLRKSLGLTQRQFAKALGTKHQHQISNWETGKFKASNPYREIMLALWKENIEKAVAPPKDLQYHVEGTDR